jgi:COP9 signalosome complex subunit 2
LQDYGFEYSDEEEGGESGTADVENLYYKAKGELRI